MQPQLPCHPSRSAMEAGTPVSGLARRGQGHRTWADVQSRRWESPCTGGLQEPPGGCGVGWGGGTPGTLRDVPEGHATGHGWPSSATGGIPFGCKLTTHLLLSFTWAHWSHPGVVPPMWSACCATGDTARDSTGLKVVLAWVTLCNSLVFI